MKSDVKSDANNYMKKRDRMKRGAIGLSINTLVIIIISLVILSGGITLLYKFISGAEDIKTDLDRKTQDELERLLVSQGKKVALPLHVADIERGDTHLFGIGILNTLGSNEKFFISVKFKKIVDESEQEITGQVDKAEVERWLLYNDEGILISDGDHHKESILVNVPKNAVKGQYIFTAHVKTGLGEDYGNPQVFYVNVR